MEICNSSSNHKQKEINSIFINYFLDNNCEKLDMMVINDIIILYLEEGLKLLKIVSILWKLMKQVLIILILLFQH